MVICRARSVRASVVRSATRVTRAAWQEYHAVGDVLRSGARRAATPRRFWPVSSGDWLLNPCRCASWRRCSAAALPAQRRATRPMAGLPLETVRVVGYRGGHQLDAGRRAAAGAVRRLARRSATQRQPAVNSVPRPPSMASSRLAPLTPTRVIVGSEIPVMLRGHGSINCSKRTSNSGASPCLPDSCATPPSRAHALKCALSCL